MFQADLDIFWAFAVFEGSNSKINNYEAVYWQKPLRSLRQLIPISFIIFVPKLFCCIKPYTPNVLLFVFIVLCSKLKPFVNFTIIYPRYFINY